MGRDRTRRRVDPGASPSRSPSTGRVLSSALGPEPRAAGIPLRDIPLRDADGTDIRLLRRFEQVAVDPANGALPSRLHHQGKVIGRSAHLVYVLFDDGDQGIVPLRPHLLRLIDAPPPWAR